MSTTAAVTPQRIMQHSFAYVASQALSTAVTLDLFTHVKGGATTVPTLAAKMQASEHGVFRLVGALTALGFLTQTDGHLGLAPDAAAFLVQGEPAYLGGLVRHQQSLWGAWAKLPEAVLKGTTPGVAVEGDEDAGHYFASFVDSLFALNFPAAQAVARHLPEARSALDVGAGSGVWSLALAQTNPQLQVTAVDRPEVLTRQTRPFAERLGLADRLSVKEGNFREVDFGHEAYDVAYLGHILHSEGTERSRTLLRRLHAALRPGGTLVIAEMVADAGHSTEVFPQLFGLNMLMNTEEGTVFSDRELEAMAREAGFTRTEWVQAPSPSPILLANK